MSTCAGAPTADDGRKVVDRLRGVRHNSSPRLEYLRITRRELEALEALADDCNGKAL